MYINKGLVSFLLGLGLILGGCSASKPIENDPSSTEGDFPKDEDVLAPEASTDPVPAGEVEQPLSPEIASSEIVSNESSVPAIEPAPVPKSEDTSTSSYEVQVGDTLMKIAFGTYGDLYQWKKVYEENKEKITNPNSIAPGLILTLERPSASISIDRNGDKYLIKRGDTLGTISTDIYGTKKKWKKIFENNKQLIRDPNLIFAGFYLYYTLTEAEREAAEKMKNAVPTVPPAPLVQTEPIKSAPTFSALSTEPLKRNLASTAETTDTK